MAPRTLSRMLAFDRSRILTSFIPEGQGCPHFNDFVHGSSHGKREQI